MTAPTETPMALPPIIVIHALLGFFVVAWLVLKNVWTVLNGIRAHFVPGGLQPCSQDLVTKFGPWAVVTGSTDGIGKAYAEELAKKGLNIALISRNPEKLKQVAHKIETTYNVQTKIIVADFSLGSTIYAGIEKELKDITVGILVNNVGCQYSYPMYLGEVPPDQLWSIVNVNIGATTMMSRMVLGGMVQRGRGAIVNVSSGSELQPLPLFTVYAASKLFLRSFSDALRYEYQGTGVTVQHLSPLFVNTKMNDFSHRLRTSSFLVPDAQTYARSAVNTLGLVDHSTGYWLHGIQYWFTVQAPVWVRTLIGALMIQGFRRDYFRSYKVAH
ncbi:inactive hydroxysteroid dehydrogenase-like protein 1 [Ischnura elegans]|uniref:inactive hydroxysteroid dehydrogenase-like protein 1 n=1 Tax=Ischnura elegans TaxID=197161 RepID=UPI001ED86CCC|nr:inactive hydroxysteroid dehydrogenase-like protein 1 [Ischnura elegans]